MAKQIRAEHKRTQVANAAEDRVNAVRGRVFQYTETGTIYRILDFEYSPSGGHEQVVCEDQKTGEIDCLPSKTLENFVPIESVDAKNLGSQLGARAQSKSQYSGNRASSGRHASRKWGHILGQSKPSRGPQDNQYVYG